jgi:hypothetical protein
MRRRILWGLAWALGLAILAEVALPMGVKETAPWWHRTTASFGVYGVGGCMVLVFVAKFLGKLGLQAPEPDPGAEAAAPLDPADPGRAGEGGPS